MENTHLSALIQSIDNEWGEYLVKNSIKLLKGYNEVELFAIGYHLMKMYEQKAIEIKLKELYEKA